MNVTQEALQIPINKTDVLSGDLSFPYMPGGIIVFAHGSGSSRHSPRNQFVAKEFNREGFATFLLDLLTAREDVIDQHSAQFRFDIQLLAARLVLTIEWLKHNEHTQTLPLGLFGASTGSAAAMISAAEKFDEVLAVVSRGGRPDLAAQCLARLKAPTLLIVGGADLPVIKLNKEAMIQMHCEHKLEVVSNATHLFEERGALERVARLATDWFSKYLVPPTAQSTSSSVASVRK